MSLVWWDISFLCRGRWWWERSRIQSACNVCDIWDIGGKLEHWRTSCRGYQGAINLTTEPFDRYLCSSSVSWSIYPITCIILNYNSGQWGSHNNQVMKAGECMVAKMDLVVALSERLTVLLKIIYHNIKRYQTNIIDHNGVVFVGLLVINLKRSGQPRPKARSRGVKKRSRGSSHRRPHWQTDPHIAA